MVKKGVITALILVVFLVMAAGMVSAGELFNKWIISGSTFEFDGKDCSVKYYGQIGKISLKIGDDRIQIELGDCEEKDTISYCFEQLDQDEGEYKDGKAYPGVKLVFKRSEPDIKITRSFSTKKPKINEKVDVDVTVKNTGDVRATNLVLIESFPPAFSLYTTTATPYGTGWKYETFLDPGDEKKFKYTFKPSAIIDHESVVHATFSYPAGTGETNSDPVSISVAAPIEITHNLSLDAVKLDEITTYAITIENIDTKDVDVDIEIVFPHGVDLVSQSRDFTKEDSRRLTFSGEIRGEKKKTLTAELRGNKNGEYEIKVNGEFISPTITLSKQLTKKIIVSESDIIPFLEITPHDVISDDLYKLTAKITNKLDTTLSGIDLTISGPLIKTLKFTDEKLIEKQTLTLVDVQYMAPDIAAPLNLTVTLTGDYRDAKTGNMYQFETTDFLNIKPSENVIKIVTDAPKGVSKGNDFEFKAFAKNMKSALLSDVTGASSIPKGIQIKGNPYGTVNIGGTEQKELFSITLNVPETFESDVLVIQTTVNAEYKGKFVKETHNTRISLTGDIAAEKPIEEVKEDVIEEVIGEKNESPKNVSVKIEKEKGFFGKIWAWIKGLF